MHFLIKTFILAMPLVCIAQGNLVGQLNNGHFSSWENVPHIIESVTETDYRDQFDQLHKLTWIKLGFPQASMGLNKEDHQRYMLKTKARWKQWWASTGKPVSTERKQDAKIDQAAFQMAWNFIGTKKERPKTIPPVWIPKNWTLYVSFKNGDYQGREDELWIIERLEERASLTKLRQDYIRNSWKSQLVLSELDDFSPEQADKTLKAICYLNKFAPPTNAKVPNDTMTGLYYPNASLRLRDGGNRIVWNTQGYEFSKSVPEYGDGVCGRSCYFLKTTFAEKDNWTEVSEPTSEQLAATRRFLAFSKPYFSTSASLIVKLFGSVGQKLERDSLLDWAEKQKAATNPDMDWTVRCSDFSTGAKVNVLGFTRLQMQKTLEEIKRIDVRLKDNQDLAEIRDTAQEKVKELELHAANMLATEKKDDEDELQSYPQPLRDLIKADRHPDDSDLSHLSAAVQVIRQDPDPELFKQLILELDDGTLRMRSLLTQTLLNDHDLLDLKPWGAPERAVAINSCIESLPLARKKGTESDLVQILLRVFGGGKISIEGRNGPTSIEVLVSKHGYSVRSGGASIALSMEEAQKELRRLYANSKKK